MGETAPEQAETELHSAVEAARFARFAKSRWAPPLSEPPDAELLSGSPLCCDGDGAGETPHLNSRNQRLTAHVDPGSVNDVDWW